MKIEEIKDGNFSRINIVEHRAIIKTYTIMYNSEQDRYNQLCKYIEELSESTIHFRGEQKKLIKAFAQIDERFKDLYNELYPRGGYRGGGRPKGSRTDKTERLNLAVTPDEKAFLIKALEDYRAGKTEPEPAPTDKPVKVKKVSDDYIRAVEEIQKEQEQSRPKLRTLDEAFKEYQEKHKGGKNGK